jgi:hypothetical protein
MEWYVAVPETTPVGDVCLVIDGRDPIRMQKSGHSGWTASVQASGGETLKYSYTSPGGDSLDRYTVHVVRSGQKVNDGVRGWASAPFSPRFTPPFSIGVYMSDTWGRNYNMMMFEDTRANIDSSFDRVAKTGASEVYVHDFQRAIFDEKNADWVVSTAYHFEGDVFENDMRDEAMTREDMAFMAKAAHDRGLKIWWRTSITFANMQKYILAGAQGNIGSDVASDWERWSKTPRSEEWTRTFMQKYRAMLKEKAAMLQQAGFDGMILTPGWHTPYFHPNEKMANTFWKETIADVKSVFSGRVGIVLDTWGFVEGSNGNEDWTQYDYYKDADDCYFYFYYLPGSYAPQKGAGFDEIRSSMHRYLDAITARAATDKIRVSLVPGIFSYRDSLSIADMNVDVYDINNPKVKAAQPDWISQADAYEALFEASEGRSAIARVVPNGYWWDDAMDPAVPPKISIGITWRGKPAEGVVTSWGTAVKAEK